MLAELRHDVVVFACAVSAGIHGALTPAHFREGAAIGTGFAAATVLLGALALALTLRPALAPAVPAAVLLGLLAGWALAVTAGIPLVHPEPEPVAGLALATKAVEALGLAAALTFPQPKGARHALR